VVQADRQPGPPNEAGGGSARRSRCGCGAGLKGQQRGRRRRLRHRNEGRERSERPTGAHKMAPSSLLGIWRSSPCCLWSQTAASSITSTPPADRVPVSPIRDTYSRRSSASNRRPVGVLLTARSPDGRGRRSEGPAVQCGRRRRSRPLGRGAVSAVINRPRRSLRSRVIREPQTRLRSRRGRRGSGS